MNAKKFKYYHIFKSSITRALSEHRYNLIRSLKNQKDKQKITYGTLPNLFIKSYDQTIQIIYVKKK